MIRGPAPGPFTVLRGHHSDVQALVFHPELDALYSGNASGELWVWSTTSGRSFCNLKLHSNAAGIIGLACLSSAGSSLLVSQGREGTVRIWALAADGSLSDSEPLREFCTMSYTFCRMSVLPAADSAEPSEPSDPVGLVAAPGEDPSTAELWGLQSASKLVSFALPPGVTYGLCMSMHLFRRQGQTYLAAGYEDGNVAVWAAAAPRQPLMATQLHKEPVMALTIDSTASGGVGGSAGKQVVAFRMDADARTKVARTALELHREFTQGGVSGSAEKQLVAFRMDTDSRTMAARKTLELNKEGISDIALRRDDKVFATAGWDGRVRVYNYRKAAALAVLKYHTAAATMVAFSPGNVLASASRDSSVALWSVYRDVT